MKRFVCFFVLLVSVYLVSTAQTEDYTLEEDSVVHRDIFERGSRWVRELRNIIIVPPKTESDADSFNIQSPDLLYRESEGLTITSIRIIRLKPFGTSVTDDEHPPITLFGRAGNTIHVSTREFVIRNMLLFREGDNVDGFKLAYSERYIRSLEYIGDARVTAIPISENEAEVVVVVQDILPYLVSLDTNFESRASVTFTNHNLIGLGLEMQNGIFINKYKDNLMGYRAMLRSSNIGRSLVSIQADYLDRYETKRYGFIMQRDFHAPATKYAGHLSFYNARTPVRFYESKEENPNLTPLSIRYNQWDAWLGRSFQVNKSSMSNQSKNIALSIGARRMQFIDRPEHSQERYYRFQNRTTYLASVTYSQQSFYHASMIYNYGRTEDIPYGYLFSIIGGKEMNEMDDRPYIGAISSAGYFLPVGYLSGAVSYGSFFNNGIVDQGVIDFEMNYFSSLYVTGAIRQRSYIRGHYTRQLFNRLEDKLIIDDEHGIPGFRNDSVLGRQRFNLSFEQNVFLPREIYGFRFVLYAFTNLSWLGGYEEPVILSTLYSSFGIGVRIRNNRLIFNTLQMQIAYFPNIPKNSHFRHINFSGEKVLKPRDFMPKAPDVMPLY